MLSSTIIVTTYNWPDALRLSLRSILEQSITPDQVIVADDGSGSDTAEMVEDILRPSTLRWRHVWHQDKGVRQSRIKNLAVKYSDFSYLIFVDQDVVLHPNFVADHLSMAHEGIFLQGKRSLLPGYYTQKVLIDGSFITPPLWMRGLRNRKNSFRSSFLKRFFARPRKFQTSLRGCNLSMFKSDFLKVDGFDETFDESWGREDSDICYRMFHSGIRIITLWFSALQYHLKHEVIKNWERERLDSEIQQNLKEKRVKALKGFSQLSSEGEIIGASS